MDTLELEVAGEFWDMQLYRRYALLFSADGKVLTLTFDDLLKATVADAKALTFLRSALYSPGLFRDLDEDFLQLFTAKLKHLRESLSPTSADGLAEYADIQDWPFPSPPADTGILRDTLYVATPEGGYFGPVEWGGPSPLPPFGVHQPRVPTYSLALGGSKRQPRVLFCAGDEGVLEVVGGLREPPVVNTVAATHCTVASWLEGGFLHIGSLLGSGRILTPDELDRSHEGSPQHLPEFEENFIVEGDGDHSEPMEHKLSLSWAVWNRVYRAFGNEVYEYRWSVAEPLRPRLDYVRTMTLEHEVRYGYGARFAGIAETDLGLELLLKSGETQSISGEIVRCRSFPRSRNYLRHLAVIYDDRVVLRVGLA